MIFRALGRTIFKKKQDIGYNEVYNVQSSMRQNANFGFTLVLH